MEAIYRWYQIQLKHRKTTVSKEVSYFASRKSMSNIHFVNSTSYVKHLFVDKSVLHSSNCLIPNDVGMIARS